MENTKKMDPKPVVINEQLKNFIVNEMKGSDIKLVIQKNLVFSDVQQVQNRLTMPVKQLATTDFLTDDERRVLATFNNEGIDVHLVGPKLRTYNQPMKLKLWNMPSSKNYVLLTNWYNFVKDNNKELTKGKKVQVWSFRRNSQLCFAVASPHD